MKQSLLLKMATIAGLVLVLVVPLLMIQGKITERSLRAAQVQQQIAHQVGGPQHLAGPMIVVPRVRRVMGVRSDCQRGEDCTVAMRKEVLERQLPEVLNVDGELKSWVRYRGIYGAPVYQGLFSLRASFADGWRQPAQADQVLGEATPLLVVRVGDLRGLVERPQIRINDRLQPLVPTGQLPDGLGEGSVAVRLPADLQGPFTVQVRLNLNGSEALSVLPLAKETDMSLRADWPHPGFVGLALPVERDISDRGFSARWHTNSLAAASAIHCDQTHGRCQAQDQRLQVDLVQPVTGLLSSERALKYSFLIVVLTFAAFFLFEVLRRYPLHAMQYLLVGLAQAMFYLLLVALSEHLRFAWAYLAAALACCGLIGIYLVAVLRSARAGWGFALSLLLVQGMIYGILMAEDYALLMGALLLFAALAAVMGVTRRLDWHGFSAGRNGVAP
ncbi:inner membrane protein [Alcanivorax hongdengensis A-11-3]|uniref:Inner membrane protein n=1 Tax=Alcanivorax hongdengensis A-11-3 TaxID=1177179 RepID=L0W9V1_9GAMM|nr:cell envelope integrity protein CreD [Alcanivorax hongdengensis]EKF73741.1 inner membrane protein [Alcanivorax hongdengensis A-11-3]